MQNIPGVDELIFSKRRRLTISVSLDGKVTVRAPLRTSQSAVLAFISAHQDWIDRAKAKLARLPRPQILSFEEGSSLPYLGTDYLLHLVEKQKGGLAFVSGEGFYLQRDCQAQGMQLLEKFYREETRRLVLAYLAHYAPLNGFSVGAVRINAAKTRWGSCSSQNKLNFSLRLAMTPLACLEYVVVHELAHTRHHNHGAAFWALVAQILPRYTEAKAWLRKQGLSLPVFN